MSRTPDQLDTPRLKLRPPSDADADAIVVGAGSPEVAATTLRIPHPYVRADAERWLAHTAACREQGSEVCLAIERRATPGLIGVVGLSLALHHGRAELSYWLARPFWSRGFTTEAARALVAWGFQDLGLHRIDAHAFLDNPASCRVLEKIGMTREGTLREHVRKGDVFKDLAWYGRLRTDAEPT